MIRKTSLTAILAATVGCAGVGTDIGDSDITKGGDGKFDTSAEAVFVNFEFDGEVLTDFAFNDSQTIQDQLLYTIGHLNGDRGVGRLDKIELTDVTRTAEGDQTRISYHAVLPVAWGDKDDVPESYTLTIPRDISFDGQQAFTEKYKDSCVDFGAHDVDSGSMWYYFRPERFGCNISPEDVFEFDVAVSLSDRNTTGKFPEYDRVWEDDTLKVVAVFGKYEDGKTSNNDAGIRAYNTFLNSIKNELQGTSLETTPPNIPRDPGVDVPEAVFNATLSDGKTVEVVALLVDNVRTAGADFNARYAELSGPADLIIYNGHAGLGANIRAMAQKGEWIPNQYHIVFMNGCDTYAYVDTAIMEAHAALNPDDPTGSKHVDMVTNALPSFFASMAGASMSLVRGLLDFDEPLTYEQIFTRIDRSQVILVTGEEDNTFVPGGSGGGEAEPWAGLSEIGTVVRDEETRFTTPTLAAGTYSFDLTGNSDADLYVRIGQAPTERNFDCRPFKGGSTERCIVTLPAPAAIHVVVRGWNDSSDWTLAGSRQ